MTFTLDTSGAVRGSIYPTSAAWLGPSGVPRTWGSLDPFTQGYVEALFASLRPAFYRIREGVKPYGGKRLQTAYRTFDPDNGSLREVTGYVHISASKVATAQRLYRSDELDAEPTAFSNLAPETLAAILKDCTAVLQIVDLYADPKKARDQGTVFWTARQNGRWELRGFPVLTPYLGDDGKVRLRDGAGQ
jgi:hypothetical protein